jgi:hypothetical protein
MEIDDDLAVRGERILLQSPPILQYSTVRYWDLYTLVNQPGYMTGKFPREPDYPINMILSNLADIAHGQNDILGQIPAILGVEVIIMTRDGIFVAQQRSTKEAVYRGVMTSGVSAGYEPNKQTGRSKVGEMVH